MKLTSWYQLLEALKSWNHEKYQKMKLLSVFSELSPPPRLLSEPSKARALEGWGMLETSNLYLCLVFSNNSFYRKNIFQWYDISPWAQKKKRIWKESNLVKSIESMDKSLRWYLYIRWSCFSIEVFPKFIIFQYPENGEVKQSNVQVWDLVGEKHLTNICCISKVLKAVPSG